MPLPRGPQDALTNRTKALPAAGATAVTSSIDLGEASPGNVVRHIDVEFGHDALPSLADAKTATLQLEDSADDSTFAAIPALATLVSTGAGGAGAAANKRTVVLPPTVRRYLRLSTAVAAAGGDSTAKNSFLKLKY